MSKTIAIIEDDLNIARWLSGYCEREGYQTISAHNGKEGLAMALKQRPDLVLLDIMLPGMDGIQVCQALRRQSSMPIIMLTAKGQQEDRVKGLETGADDYIVKPFDPVELIARIKAVLRRSNNEVQNELRSGDISLNVVEKRTTVKQQTIELSKAQFAILHAFMRHPGQVLNREQLIKHAFGEQSEAFDRAIDNHIMRLRKQLKHAGVQPIQTVYGMGYKFSNEAD